MFLSFDSTFELDTFVHVVQYWKTLLVYSEIINLSTKIWNLSLMFIFATLFNHIGDTNKNNALSSDTEHDLLTWSKVHLPRTPEKWYICRLCSLFLEFDTAICKRCPVLHSTVNCSHCVRLRTYKKEVGDTNSKPPFKKGYRKRETIFLRFPHLFWRTTTALNFNRDDCFASWEVSKILSGVEH